MREIPTKLVGLERGRFATCERAAKDFSKLCRLNAEESRIYNQTLVLMHNYAGGLGDFWAVFDDTGEMAGFLLGRYIVDLGESVYWITHAWVRKDRRRTSDVKEWWEYIRKQIKSRTVMMVSSRGARAYSRFLGRGTHEYGKILKQDI